MSLKCFIMGGILSARNVKQSLTYWMRGAKADWNHKFPASFVFLKVKESNFLLSVKVLMGK